MRDGKEEKYKKGELGDEEGERKSRSRRSREDRRQKQLRQKRERIAREPTGEDRQKTFKYTIQDDEEEWRARGVAEEVV